MNNVFTADVFAVDICTDLVLAAIKPLLNRIVVNNSRYKYVKHIGDSECYRDLIEIKHHSKNLDELLHNKKGYVVKVFLMDTYFRNGEKQSTKCVVTLVDYSGKEKLYEFSAVSFCTSKDVSQYTDVSVITKALSKMLDFVEENNINVDLDKRIDILLEFDCPNESIDLNSVKRAIPRNLCVTNIDDHRCTICSVPFDHMRSKPSLPTVVVTSCYLNENDIYVNYYVKLYNPQLDIVEYYKRDAILISNHKDLAEICFKKIFKDVQKVITEYEVNRME